MFRFFQKLSFTQQLTLPIICIGILVLGGLATMTAIESFDEANRFTLKNTLEVGERSSLQLKGQIDKSFFHAQALGELFLKESLTGTTNRKRMYDSLEALLEKEPQYLATWSAWEENAYDGRDKDFANKEFHEKSGRVYPWLVRQDGKIFYKTLLNPETPDLGDWYFIPVKEKKSVLVDPYAETVNGKMVMMTSAVYTVLHEGSVKALFGIDISLDTITKIVNEIRPFPDSKVYLITDKNIIVAGPTNDELMKPFVANEQTQSLISSHRSGAITLESKDGAEQFLVVPLPIFNTDQNWSLIIRTPESTILADANKKLVTHMILSLLGLIALMGVVYFCAKRSESKISSVSSGLTGSAHSISEGIRQLNSTGSQLAQDSTSAAASIEETAASLEEISSIVQTNSSNAQIASNLSAESVHLTKDGEQKISDLIITMDKIEISSRKIEEIIHIIDDIAFQTNLLALNASVEAARAGDHGKGFAVVAEAVRSLAQRSAKSAHDITDLISTSVGLVRESVVRVRENREILKNVSSSVDKVAQINREIAEASQQQAIGIQQVSTAVSGLDQMIQKNAAEAENIVSMASHIQENSESMNSTVQALKAS